MIYFPYQSLDSARIIAMIQLYHTAYMDVFLKALAYVAMSQLPSTNMPVGCSSYKLKLCTKQNSPSKLIDT